VQPVWTALRPGITADHLGFLPGFLNEDDPRSAKEQFNENYISGWDTFEGFEFDKKRLELSYPGDPPTKALAATMLHKKEVIILFEHAWVVIWQKDDSWEAARLD